jgi:hypothetical protein
MHPNGKYPIYFFILSVTSFEDRWERYLCIFIVLQNYLTVWIFQLNYDMSFQYSSQYRYCWITPNDKLPGFNFRLWHSLWYVVMIFSDLLSTFCFIQFHLLFFRSQQKHSSIPYVAEHGNVLIWKYRIEGYVFTVICIPSFGIDKNVMFTMWILSCAQRGVMRRKQYMHFHYCIWICPIEPTRRYFHICHVQWLSMFPFI